LTTLDGGDLVANKINNDLINNIHGKDNIGNENEIDNSLLEPSVVKQSTFATNQKFSGDTTKHQLSMQNLCQKWSNLLITKPGTGIPKIPLEIVRAQQIKQVIVSAAKTAVMVSTVPTRNSPANNVDDMDIPSSKKNQDAVMVTLSGFNSKNFNWKQKANNVSNFLN
jgi:hypothetical protein